MNQLTKKEYEQTNWWKDTQKWIAKIPQEIDSKKGSPPLKKWKVFEADTWGAACDAACDVAIDAARGAACDDACDVAIDAAIDAAREAAIDAAIDAARHAASDAARGAAWGAAREAAIDAAREAGLFARVKICAGLSIDKKHVAHAKERWEANKRGFRVLCDVNATLYVYRKKEA